MTMRKPKSPSLIPIETVEERLQLITVTVKPDDTKERPFSWRLASSPSTEPLPLPRAAKRRLH